ELARREPHRARRAERRILDGVLDVQAERLAVAEVAADRLREERDGDDDIVQAVPPEQLENVLHARLADDRDHRLRLVGGERPQPRPLPARHDDSLHRRSSLHASRTYTTPPATPPPRPTQQSPSGPLVRPRGH